MAIALAVMFLADCMPAGATPAAQMACCEAMNHECGQNGEPQACCSTESSRISAFRTVEHVSLQPPVAVVNPFSLVDLPLALDDPDAAFGHLAPVKPPGVPKYILSATFRI